MDDDKEIGRKSNKSSYSVYTMSCMMFVVLFIIKMKLTLFPLFCHIEEEQSVINGTKIEWMPTDTNKHNNINHIDFYILPVEPEQPVSLVRIQYRGLLKRELILRKMFLELGQGKILESMQKILKMSIMESVEIIIMRVAINWWTNVGENGK